MFKTKFARRMDPVGRIVVPTKLRDLIDLRGDEVYDFYITEGEDGNAYICINTQTSWADIAPGLDRLTDSSN